MRTEDWSVSTIDSGDVWTQIDTLARPNEALPLGSTGTLIQNQLADASMVYIIPETKFNYDQLQLIWYADNTGAIKTQIEGYVQNATRLKLIDQNAVEYVGYFIQVTPVWLTGISDEYDIASLFLRENV